MLNVDYILNNLCEKSNVFPNLWYGDYELIQSWHIDVLEKENYEVDLIITSDELHYEIEYKGVL